MNLTPEQLVHCKKLWIKKTLGETLAKDIDESNCGKKHLIGIEGTPHPKTGVCKTLVCESGDWLNNEMPEDIIKTAAAAAEPKKEFMYKNHHGDSAPKRCAFLEWACLNPLPVSCRNQNLVPNLVAYTQDRSVWQQCASTQSKQLSEFENWAMRKTQFNCKQLQVYAKKLEVNYLCELCGGKKHERKTRN